MVYICPFLGTSRSARNRLPGRFGLPKCDATERIFGRYTPLVHARGQLRNATQCTSVDGVAEDNSRIMRRVDAVVVIGHTYVYDLVCVGIEHGKQVSNYSALTPACLGRRQDARREWVSCTGAHVTERAGEFRG